MNIFKLEEYLSKYEFTAPYLLCCSDAESFKMQDILALAEHKDLELWNNLVLSYTETFGLPALREQIATSLYPQLKSENILCFAGAEEGIYCALNVLCEPSDHVIVFTPCYQSLMEIPKSLGCEMTLLELREDNQWRIDLEEVKRAIKPHTKVLVMNFPHNPTGQVITQSELDALVKICEAHGIWLFSDEVYRLLGNPHEPWAQPAAEAYPKALSLGVMSKAFGMAGLRIGWLACQDTDLLTKMCQLKHYTSICNSAPAEVISLIALKNMDTILARNNEIVTQNLALLDDFFQEHQSLFSWVRPQGGCVGWVKYHSPEPVEKLCANLVKEKGVLLLPGSIYDFSGNHFRIGFGRKNMADALERLREFVRKK